MTLEILISRARSRGFSRTAAIALGCAGILGLSGCRPSSTELKEASNLEHILAEYAPAAKQLLLEENSLANELKVTLEESGGVENKQFGERFRSYEDRLVSLRDRRQQILDTISQGVYTTPFVFYVRDDAAVQLRDEIARTEAWIRFAKNVRLRVELGRQKDFPELGLLAKALDTYLGQPPESPLADQFDDLQKEFPEVE